MESPEKVYGRLSEAVHTSGYSLERAMGQFEWLLEENRWKKVGSGFENIKEFLKTLEFKEFKLAIEQREKITKKLAELNAPNTAIAETLGVSEKTIRRDISANAENEHNIDIDFKEVTNEGSANAEFKETPFEGSGQKLEQQRQRSIEKEKEKEKRLNKEKENRIDEIKNIDLRTGDFKDVLIDVFNIDAIITDPPYPYEFIDCFSELSLFASEHLKEDGFCVVYSGQYHLPEVIKRLSEYLTYVWTFCLYHKGKKQLVNGVNIMCGWKPILIFSNGKKKMRFSAYDVIISEMIEKFSHEWQQSESGIEKLIEIFTEPGQLIIDPFAGSATFLKVANEMRRNTIGAEING